MNPIVDLPEPLSLGLHALVELGRVPGQCLSTKTIAQSIGAPEPHLSKILQRLTRAGYVESIRGPGGGYQLARQPGEICVLNIFELLGGPFVPSGCSLDHNRLEASPCLIGAMMDELTLSLRNYLASKTLEHLLRFYDLPPDITIGVSVMRRRRDSIPS